MTKPNMTDGGAGIGDEVSREELHTRTITISGYRRSDGLFEVEGELRDTKPFDFRPPSDERVVKAGDSVHHMGVRIVFDESMTVRDVKAMTHAAPYADCHDGPATLKTLIGLSMTRGWSAEVKRRLAGASSCVHLAGLMVPMATAAFQSMTMLRQKQAAEASPDSPPPKLDTCLAYSRHGDLVRRRWPTHWIARADSE